MIKRVERKRKRRDEEAELGLDQDMKETLGLVHSDTDESDSDSERDAPSDDSDADADIGQDEDKDGGAASEDEGPDAEFPISVAEALKDPIYLISLDPTIHGCVLCKGKLIKSAGMTTAHKNANLHKRRFEHFKRLAVEADPQSNAWDLIGSIRSSSDVRGEKLQGLSKRALKRQEKTAAIREKRKRHKELKAKAMAKQALKKHSMTGGTKPPTPSAVNSGSSPLAQNQQGEPRKKRKVKSNAATDTTKPDPYTKTSSGSKKSVLKPRLKSTRKVAKLS